MRSVLLLDTSAFIVGYEVVDVDMEHYTVPAVGDELREGAFPRLRYDNAVHSGRLRVVSPDPRFVFEVKNAAAEMGEEGVLSETDVQLLALGLYLRDEGLEPIVVSDDYSVQNIADSMELGFKSLATQGIRRRFEWVTYCPGCHRTFRAPQVENVCPVCGTGLKRKPGKKVKATGWTASSGLKPKDEGV